MPPPPAAAAAAAADDRFKQPGAVPFKWEILPGVPKPQLPPPSPVGSNTRFSSAAVTPHKKLSPPPASFHHGPTLAPPTKLRTQSFRSDPRSGSDRWRFGQTRSPEVVSLAGCFPTSPMTVTLQRRKDVEGNNSKKKKKTKKAKTKRNSKSEPETDYRADLMETPERWSVSTRKSFSLFRSSPLSAYSPSFASRYSSPRPATDTEWGGFGLF